MGFLIVYLFDGVVNTEALPITLAGYPGYVFGVYADPSHNTLYVRFILTFGTDKLYVI